MTSTPTDTDPSFTARVETRTHTFVLAFLSAAMVGVLWQITTLTYAVGDMNGTLSREIGSVNANLSRDIGGLTANVTTLAGLTRENSGQLRELDRRMTGIETRLTGMENQLKALTDAVNKLVTK